MDDLHFMDGVLWYLNTRNWAFEKIHSMSKGSQEPLDLQMYHYLYFSISLVPSTTLQIISTAQIL